MVLGRARHPEPHALLRLDHVRPLRRHHGPVRQPQPHHPGRLRGDRRLQRREDLARAVHGRGGPRLPRRGRLRRTVHRQHHGHRLRDARHLADGLERRPRHRSPQGRSGLRVRQAGDGPRQQGHDAALDRDPQELRERHRRASMATGGSTNAVLHLMATRASFGVKLSIEDFDRISQQTPVLADLKPWGNYTAPEMYEAGGMAVVGKRLLEAGLAPREEKTVTGRTIGDEIKRAAEPPGQKVIKPLATAAQADGRHRHPARQPGARRLRDQALRPEQVLAPRARAGLRARGGRVQGRQGGQDQAQRRDRDPLRGSQGRPGHARDAARHRRAAGRGPRRYAWR